MGRRRPAGRAGRWSGRLVGERFDRGDGSGSGAMTQRTRRRVEVRGIVQGVGFRPAVHRHATSLDLVGFVGNDGHGVFIEVEGSSAAVDRFVEDLPDVAPPLALVEEVTSTRVALRGEREFVIVESARADAATTLVSPDVAPCAACIAELVDPADRRYRYPFVNCTDCGPRYSIIRALPYDRPLTTMASFTMCEPCAAEYHDPTDRRFHAQPTCCPDCGPQLTLRDGDFEPVAVDDVVDAVVDHLRAGRIVAVKGLGGYHLAVDAGDEDAVARLRARKHREEKPFAVLVADLDAARAIADVGEIEADLLVGPERPIVLVPRRAGDGAEQPIAPSVAPGNRSLGLLLPPTPLHLLLAASFGGPLVLTSGNRSHEPIASDDATVHERLSGIADAYCTHDRPIHVRVDDSVTRVVGDRQLVLRRARGHAPRPVRVPGGFPRPTLAVGAQLKSTVCVGRDDRAFVSQHLGDLDDHRTFMAFEQAIDHLCDLFGVQPEVVAHDLHPDLVSTTHARAMDGVEVVAVQHHHAHIAACLADNERAEPVIGVAFDGLGFGPDGTIWGGEILRADLVSAERLGHLARVPMPGGDRAVREPWRMAAVHLAAALDGSDLDDLDDLAVVERNRDQWSAVLSVARAGIHAPLTSSAGRLFDAVAAIAGVRDRITYEGQAAIELEQRVDLHEAGTYPTETNGDDPFVIDPAPLIRAVVADQRAGMPTGVIAGRFHHGVVDLIAAACERSRAITGLRTVALSGGVFQNALLVERLVPRLADAGFEVLTHRRFPANDGGISLGQAAIVAARDRAAATPTPL